MRSEVEKVLKATQDHVVLSFMTDESSFRLSPKGEAPQACSRLCCAPAPSNKVAIMFVLSHFRFARGTFGSFVSSRVLGVLCCLRSSRAIAKHAISFVVGLCSALLHRQPRARMHS